MLKLIVFLFISINIFAQEPIGFKAQLKPTFENVKVRVLKNSLDYERHEESLLLPTGWVEVRGRGSASDFSIHYADSVHGFQLYKKGMAIARFHASFLESGSAELYFRGKSVGVIEFVPAKKKPLVDATCFPYGLKVKGLENDLVSIGCKKQVYGKIGNEKALLNVYWAASGWRPVGGKEGVHELSLTGSGKSVISLENAKGEKRNLVVYAKAPTKRKRLSFALGFGPYDYLALDDENIYDDAVHFMYMLYGKFTLTEKHSFKLFDAYIEGASTFNNFGMYFSSDVAKLWNNRVVINTLLGFQDLYFDLPGAAKQHQIIYPQGLEMIYNHPFGLKNYKLMAGGFVALGGGLDYSNVWLRFGKGIFYELNYLKWAEDESKAEAFGLSVGIPLFSLF